MSSLLTLCLMLSTLAPLPRTEQTVLWHDFSGDLNELSSGQFQAKVRGKIQIRDGALHVDEDGQLVLSEAGKLLSDGPFTIDLDMQFSQRSGVFLATDSQHTPFSWGILLRGAGILELRIPVIDKDGKPTSYSDRTWQVMKHTGPLRHDTTYRHTLTFDGQRNWTVYINGIQVFETQLPQDMSFKLSDRDLILGQARTWKSDFVGSIQNLRISNAVIKPTPPQRFLPTSLDQCQEGYYFDMGLQDSPVQTGYLAVTPQTDMRQTGFGWDTQPLRTADAWFSPGRYDPSAEGSVRKHWEAVRSWRDRDALVLPSGATFHADLPPGQYAVSVTFGDLRQNTKVDRIEVNGQSISDDLRMYRGKDKPTYIMTIAEGQTAAINRTDRTARGIVTVDKDGLNVTVRGHQNQPVGILAIEAVAWQSPIITKIADAMVLRWQGLGEPPKGFVEAARAYAQKNFDQAVTLAQQIDDPLTRATMWAWILGYPNATDQRHLDLCNRIRQTLLPLTDVRARSLLRITDLMDKVLHIQMDDTVGIDDLVGTTNWRHLRCGADFALRIKDQEPYFGRARLLAGAFIYQQVQQNGALIDNWTLRKPHRGIGWPPPIVYLLDTLKQYPQCVLARIYAGEKMPNETTVSIPGNTPQWAALSHRTIFRTMEVIRYWTDQRQAANGALGGGIGDDVETLRWWSIGHMVCDDEHVRNAWRKIADWAHSYNRGYGFTVDESDAEHGAEPFSDTHTFLPFIDFGTPRFERTLKRQKKAIYQPMLDTWTAVNPQGYRMFKSYVYSARDVDADRNTDVPYNLRTVNPLLTYAWFTHDTQAIKLIADYATSWRDAIMAEGQGKPAGIVPMVITFDQRQFKWPQSPNWYDPGYYRFPTGYTDNIYSLMLAAYELTGEERYLDPIRLAMKLLREVEPPSTANQTSSYYRIDDLAYMDKELKHGSLRWALWHGRRAICDGGARYRLLTGDTQFDDVLMQYGSAVTRSRLAFVNAENGKQRRLAMEPIKKALTDVLEHMDYNIALRTTEPKSTDRVWVHGTEQIIAMSTGTHTLGSIRGRERQWPLFGVTWQNTGLDVAIWITHNTPDRLEGYVYNVSEQPKKLGMRLWRLAQGNYQLTVRSSDGFEVDSQSHPLEQSELTLHARGDQAQFTALPRQEIHFQMKRR